ncbi:sigma-54 interaction domain-containing protein [Fictibacillus enclensis]|uniref:sigma-54 interaction domain-containing protein n=1 Tax=Fictibacillus enclensis TaxID=1017270 RepID=UPI0024C0369E|nr:sigma 54-interacting transcriptional regulator [Fictibacillus enclensis]WHY70126.1 sigma 54-interacting transcriptional regulator [Fictibacillus enclensis]
MIALYKCNEMLESCLVQLFHQQGIRPSCFHSKKALIDQSMNPFVLIAPLPFVDELQSLNVPIVPLSLHRQDFLEAEIRTQAHKEHTVLFVSTKEKEWLELESQFMDEPFFPVFSSEHELNNAAKYEVSLFIPAWHKQATFPQWKKENVVFVNPSTGTLMAAVRQALQLMEVTKEFVKEKLQVQAIVHSAHDGVIAVDKNGRITLTNEHAKKYLGLEAEVIGRNITDFIPNSDMLRVLQAGKKEIGDIATIHDKQYLINRYPVLLDNTVVGAVSNIKEITDLQKMEMKLRKRLHENGLEAKYTLRDIIGETKTILNAKQQAEIFAKTDATVLITGESGTGKELFAQGIHLQSRRAIGPFVAMNCAAIPEHLLESELFGYEEGSFTGARKGGKPGLFELAHGGTLFLDEVGEMPLQIQAHLLRVLQEKTIRRVGGQRAIPVNVRIIAATNTEMEEALRSKKFRTDLFYRLNVLSLDLPPLRYRRDDIPLLVNHFMEQFNEQHSRKIIGVDSGFLPLLKQYDWPGNIRELRNVIERLILLDPGISLNAQKAKLFYPKLSSERKDCEEKRESLKENERELIQDALRKYENKTEAARFLGIGRSTLWRKMKQYDLI